MKFLHQRNETVHIRTILHNIRHYNVFICNPKLDIVGWKQLVVAHIILFHPHKRGIMICLGVAVAICAANADFLHIFLELRGIFSQLLIMPLLHGLVVPATMYKLRRVNACNRFISANQFIQIFRGIFRVCFHMKPGIHQRFVDVLQQCGDFVKQPIP